VYGFTSTLLKAIEDVKPTHIAAAFDLAGPTFRHEAYTEYKATRVKAPDDLYEQIPLVKELVTAMNIPIFEKQGFEADDLIGTVCRTIDDEKKNFETIIVTGDMDTLQLVDNNTKVYTLRKSIKDQIIYDPGLVVEKYGFGPEHVIDYKSLRGDASDNIPGVKGIGEKTATELITTYGTLDDIYAAVDSGEFKGTDKVKELLLQNRDMAYMSYRLATIDTKVPIEFDLTKCVLNEFDYKVATEMFQKYEFRSLLPRLLKLINQGKSATSATSLFDEGSDATDAPHRDESLDYILVDTEKKFSEFLQELKKQKIFAFDTETTGLDPMSCELVGLSFSWKEKQAYYIPVGHSAGEQVNKDTVLKGLKDVFESEEIKKVAHNIKFDMLVLKNAGVEVNNAFFDTMIASYLLDPLRRGHSLDSLAFIEFSHQNISIESLIGTGKKQITFDQVDIQKAFEYAAEDADIAYRLYELYAPKVSSDKTISKLLFDIEMPVNRILLDMEYKGILLDTKVLAKIGNEVGKRIDELAEMIIGYAGEDFNINSTQQLGTILFTKLGIENQDIKKTKTGISTSATELDKLRGTHPIIEPILEYRELVKLKNTYIDSLPLLVNKKDHRVHTSYSQTIAATGRLSSSDPNLQNIPVRTDFGQRIRGAFIASPGNVLVACDYSQIELRVVASIAQDEKMLSAFRDGRDIHSETASAVFGVTADEVTKDMRRIAKVVNFGIIYGMSAYGLSQAIDMDQKEAKNFIDQYFKQFPLVKKYMDDTLEKAAETGYVETLLGRRRYLPDLSSSMAQVRKAAERMAINMPIQGTAADIMKQAMIDVDSKILKKHPDIKMLLQVHDELVFEVPKDKSEHVASQIIDVMEQAYKLHCPLVVESKIGPNWDFR